MSYVSRRKFLKGLGLSAGALALAGCAPAAPQPAGSTAPESSTAPAMVSQADGPVSVTLWSSFTGKNGETEAALVKKFNESQQDVFIDYQFQGSYEETAQKVTAALQSNTAPTLTLLSDVWWFK